MAADEVHHGIEIFRRIVFPQALKLHHGIVGRDIAQQEIEQNLAERIVHRRIHFLPAEIFSLRAIGDFVGGILPDLANHHSIFIRLFEFCIEPLRERFRQFIDNVQTPAGNALRKPMMQHAVRCAVDEVHIGRCGFRDVGQGVKVPPAFVFIGEVAEIIPRIVRRLFGLERPHAIILTLAVEVTAVAARMAEHAVQNDADAFFLRQFHQIMELLIRPQNGVNLMIIAGIVMMIAFRFKHGIEINDADAELLQIIELGHNAGDIAAVEVIGDDFLRVRVLVITGIIRPAGMIDRAFFFNQLVALPIKTVGENLIHDRMLEPVRRLGALVVNGYLIGRRHIGINITLPAPVLHLVTVVTGAVTTGNNEIIPKETPFFRHFQID